MRAVLCWSVLVAVSCSSSSTLPPARFVNANPVRAVDDRRDVPRPPKMIDMDTAMSRFNNAVRQPVIRPLKLKPHLRALGVNSVDEVPDSTWFTNRIGVRDLTPDEVRRGPLTIDGPGKYLPWTVLGVKSEGYSLGLYIADSRGERYLIKFDAKRLAELETGSHMIVNRLLWACGYNVPQDSIAYVYRRDMKVADNATYLVSNINENRRLQEADLDALLQPINVNPDGRIRVLASRVVAGRVIGGHAGTGVRKDDPNDKIRHEQRRDLRGLRPIFAWVDNTDVKEGNTLDVWVNDPDRPNHHYVQHYLIDFGKSFGAMAMTLHDGRASYEYVVDYPKIFGGLVTVGLRPQLWDKRNAPAIIGIGLYEPTLDPSRWKPYTPVYDPLLSTDRYDWLWGAKLVMRFTPEQIRAAVEAAQFSDPRATDYLTAALQRRQREIGRYAFTLVNPVDNANVDPTGSSLCFDDLAIRYGTQRFAPVEHELTAYDLDGRELGAMTVTGSAPTGRVCTGAIRLAPGGAQYTILRIRTKDRAGDTFVHLARDPSTKALRVIGLYRD